MHLHYLENVKERLLIKLPIHPSTIEELALIRFWLLKLSQAHFEKLCINRGILNPEFLSVLNPRMGPRKILFHANQVEVNVSEAAITADLAQFICARLSQGQVINKKPSRPIFTGLQVFCLYSC
jgi:hypothetical protein